MLNLKIHHFFTLSGYASKLPACQEFPRTIPSQHGGACRLVLHPCSNDQYHEKHKFTGLTQLYPFYVCSTGYHGNHRKLQNNLQVDKL